MSCGTGAYVRLMEQYPLVTEAFLNLAEPYQKVALLSPFEYGSWSKLSRIWTASLVLYFMHFGCRHSTAVAGRALQTLT